MDLEEAIKLLKEMQENCKNKTIYKDEKAEAKAEAIKVVLKELEYLRKELDEYVEKSMPFWWIKEHAKRHHISLRKDTVRDYCEGGLEDFLYDIIEFVEDEEG